MVAGQVYRCDDKECNGPIKPHIIFFGENLPQQFFKECGKVAEADLLIVIGTSLNVGPFNSLVDTVPSTTDQVLINLENTGPQFDFDD